MAHGLDGDGLILIMRQSFEARLNALVPRSISERKLKIIQPYIYSIDHKLNVARYCAGLIRATLPEDFGRHRYSNSGYSSQMEYSGRCIYFASNWEQYTMSLLFFIESFAAAAFSLFDSSGQLIKEMYDLVIPSKKYPNFYNVTIELEKLTLNFYTKFLCNYRFENSSCKPWFKSLKDLRNHTTHSEVTDIIVLDTPTLPDMEEILIKRGVIQATNDQVLGDFIEECFQGLEEYVEMLYNILAQQVEAEKALPLTGRFDNQI